MRNLHRCHSLQKFSKYEKTTKKYQLRSNGLPPQYPEDWTTLTASTVFCLEDYYEKCENKYFLRNLRPVVGIPVNSTFDKKGMIPHISFSALTRL